MKKKILKKFKGSGIIRGLVGNYRRLKLPSNYRVITVIILSLFLVILISLVSLDLYKNFQEKGKIEAKRAELASEVRYWENVVGKYKDYRDAYFKLAVLEYELKDFGKSRVYLRKVLEIDPNFEVGRRFEKLLETQN